MPMNVKYGVPLFVITVLAGSIPPAVADDATALVARMRSAVHSLNYSGTLVYAQGNDLSTYQIQHSNEAGAEKESVISLEQAGKGGGEAASFSLAKFQQVQPQMEQVYSLDFGGNEAVANRSCRIVVARPRDRMRYLQRYCIDPANGMLLKYSLVDQSHQAIEQMMFTSLDVTGGGAPAAAPAAMAAAPVEQPAAPDDGGWRLTVLPPGFQQTKSLLQPVAQGQEPVRQLVLSDGMTSISVFIASTGSQVQPGAALSAGAMNIFTRQSGKYTVTLVGEVPVATLEDIAKGLQHGQ